jgi:hypothetical protein
MSHHYDETYEVYNERERKARKTHECAACKELIPAGAAYTVVFILFDGDPESLKRCARCQTIHEHLRDLGDSEQWPDERLNCGEEYKQHWGVEPPPEIARLAFLLPGEAP